MLGVLGAITLGCSSLGALRAIGTGSWLWFKGLGPLTIWELLRSLGLARSSGVGFRACGVRCYRLREFNVGVLGFVSRLEGFRGF